MEKEILKRHVQDLLRKTQFARERTAESLPVVVYRHNSLIRRRLGNVNMQLQENKATNLALGTHHRQGQTLAGHRRRHVSTVEPHPLACAA